MIDQFISEPSSPLSLPIINKQKIAHETFNAWVNSSRAGLVKNGVDVSDSFILQLQYHRSEAALGEILEEWARCTDWLLEQVRAHQLVAIIDELNLVCFFSDRFGDNTIDDADQVRKFHIYQSSLVELHSAIKAEYPDWPDPPIELAKKIRDRRQAAKKAHHGELK